jgi:hypothetical protein
MIAPQRSEPKGDSGSDYMTLSIIYMISGVYGHVDAEDAALDAIRDMLRRGRLFYSADVLSEVRCDDPRMRMLMGFAVYSEQGKKWTEATDAKEDESPIWMRVFNPEPMQSATLLRLTSVLCRTLIHKAEDVSAGPPLPGLMERCRYHSHARGSFPCYLDNRAKAWPIRHLTRARRTWPLVLRIGCSLC